MNIGKAKREGERSDDIRIIDRVINNNVVMILDPAGKERVIMGKGVGYQKKPGDILEEANVEKTFVLSAEKDSSHFLELAREIPYEYMKVSTDIVAYAEISLNKKLNESVHYLLMDHLNFAIERIGKGIIIPNTMLWEIKHYYSHEFRIGQEALEIIRRHIGVELPEEEAGFIALHILNSEMDLDMHASKEMTKMIQNVFSIIRYHFQIVIDEESLDYERFVTHLKFFIQRAMQGKHSKMWEKELMEMICSQYQEAYLCAEKIKEYIERTTTYVVADEEMVYLCVHIQRLWRASEGV